MRKSELFDALADFVCEKCEVSPDLVLSGSKISSAVDARYMIVYYLRKSGFTNDDIALIILRRKMGDKDFVPSTRDLKNKSKAVDMMYRSYFNRYEESYTFRLISAAIKEFCLAFYDNAMKSYGNRS